MLACSAGTRRRACCSVRTRGITCAGWARATWPRSARPRGLECCPPGRRRVGRRRRRGCREPGQRRWQPPAEPFGGLSRRMAIVADPSGGGVRRVEVLRPSGAQRVNEPSAYSMSSRRMPDPRAPRRSMVRCSAGRRRRSVRCCCGASPATRAGSPSSRCRVRSWRRWRVLVTARRALQGRLLDRRRRRSRRARHLSRRLGRRRPRGRRAVPRSGAHRPGGRDLLGEPADRGPLAGVTRRVPMKRSSGSLIAAFAVHRRTP